MKSWVAFLFDSKDQEKAPFPNNNRSFCKKGAKTPNKEGQLVVNDNTQIGDWWEFDSGKPDDPLFFMLMCDIKQKDELWEKVDNDTTTIEEVIECLPSKLVEWANETNENFNGRIFMHWHKDDWGLCHRKTGALQKKLASLFPNLKIRCFSSQQISAKFGNAIFNVETPVIPVKGFESWFDMFEKYWNARTLEELDSVDASYDEKTFPRHWELGESASETNKPSKANLTPLIDSESKTSTIVGQLRHKSSLISRGMAHVLSGAITGILSLIPLAVVFHYVPPTHFQCLRGRVELAVLSLVFVFSVFATCVWFLLFRASGNKEDNDGHK